MGGADTCRVGVKYARYTWVTAVLKVFLDQNHWIYLSRAFYGKPKRTEHVEAVASLGIKVDEEKLMLPLQINHLVEFLRANDRARRERLAHVFERFTKRWFFGPWSDVLSYEFSLAISTVLDTPETVQKPEMFGKGVVFSIGKAACQTMLTSGKAPLPLPLQEQLTALPGMLRDLLTFPNEPGRERQVSSSLERGERYADACERCRTPPHNKHVARRARAALYMYEHQNELEARMMAAGKTFQDFLALDPDGMSDFFDYVPSLNVDRELTVYRDRQRTRAVEANDLNDIAYLALAVPYCDAVVVEKFWAHAICQCGLDRKYGTEVFVDIQQVVDWLLSRSL